LSCLLFVQYSEGLLKPMKASEVDSCDGDDADTEVNLLENISTPARTIGASAAKTGGRRNVVDISLTNLRTELRNMFTGLMSKQTTKGSTFTASTLWHSSGNSGGGGSAYAYQAYSHRDRQAYTQTHRQTDHWCHGLKKSGGALQFSDRRLQISDRGLWVIKMSLKLGIFRHIFFTCGRKFDRKRLVKMYGGNSPPPFYCHNTTDIHANNAVMIELLSCQTDTPVYRWGGCYPSSKSLAESLFVGALLVVPGLDWVEPTDVLFQMTWLVTMPVDPRVVTCRYALQASDDWGTWYVRSKTTHQRPAPASVSDVHRLNDAVLTTVYPSANQPVVGWSAKNCYRLIISLRNRHRLIVG